MHKILYGSCPSYFRREGASIGVVLTLINGGPEPSSPLPKVLKLLRTRGS